MKTLCKSTVTVLMAALLLVPACAQRETRRFKAKKPREDVAIARTPAVVAALTGPKLEIHFINVGQGDCTLVKCPDGQMILVDSGSTDDGDPVTVRSYLLDQLDSNEPRVDLLVITHPDSDHYNFLPQVLQGVAVGRILAVDTPDAHPVNSVENWLEEFQPDRYTILSNNHFDPPNTASSFCDCGAADVYILAANIDKEPSRKNSRSIVLLIKFGEFEAVLTGDATFATEGTILERYPHDWLDVELLKIGHHGSSTTSTSVEWADVLKPEIAVASSSFNNPHGHPRKVVLERLVPHADETTPHRIRWALSQHNYANVNDFSKAIYCTATNGNIVVTSNGDEYEVSWEN